MPGDGNCQFWSMTCALKEELGLFGGGRCQRTERETDSERDCDDDGKKTREEKTRKEKTRQENTRKERNENTRNERKGTL